MYVRMYMCMHMGNMSMLTACANTVNFIHAITLRISPLYSPGQTWMAKHGINTSIYCRVVQSFIASPSVLQENAQFQDLVE